MKSELKENCTSPCFDLTLNENVDGYRTQALRLVLWFAQYGNPKLFVQDAGRT